MADEIQKQVIISVKTDSTEAETGLDNLKNKINGVNDTPLDKPFKTLKTQIREAEDEMHHLGQTVGTESKSFIEAAKKVANLKDEFGDFRKTVDAFNPDNKLQAVVGLARGATGAIQGVTGAMAFLGVESDNALETMAKLQGLMAFSDALSSVADIKDSFKNFAAVLGLTKKTTDTLTASTEAQAAATKGATIATKGFGLAFKAIGIGLIVSALAYIVTNFDSIKESIGKALPFVNNMGGTLNKLKEVAFGVGNALLKYIVGPFKAIVQAVQGDFSGSLDTIKGMFNVVKNYEEGANKERQSQADDAAKERTKNYAEALDNQISLLKKSGKDTYELEKQNNYRKLSLLKEGSDEYNKLNETIIENDADHQKKLSDAQKAASEKQLAERKAAFEKKKAQLDEERKTMLANLQEIQKIEDDATSSIAESKLDEREKELFDIQKNYDAQKKALDKLNSETKGSDEEYNKASLALKEKKGIDDLAVEKKYNKIISDFIESYNQTAFEKQKQELIDSFDEKIKVAKGKQKELLEKMKVEQVTNLNTQEILRKETVNKETTLIDVKSNNEVSDGDTPEIAVAKLQAIADATKEFKEAQFQEQLQKLGSDQDAIRNLTAKHNADLLADEQGLSKAKIDIGEKEKEAKLAMIDLISGASDAASELIGKNTVAGKALAIASTTIDTYVAAQKAYSSQMSVPTIDAPIRAALAAAAAVIQGLARVKAIVGVKVPAKSGDTSGGNSAPQITAPTITQTMLSPEETNKVQDVRVTNTNQQPIKAYITQSDLNDNQSKQDFFNRLSSI